MNGMAAISQFPPTHEPRSVDVRHWRSADSVCTEVGRPNPAQAQLPASGGLDGERCCITSATTRTGVIPSPD